MSEDPSNAFKTVEKPSARGKRGQFKPGTAAGPGRPKGSVSIVSSLKTRMEEVPAGQTRSYVDQIVEAILQRALEGDTQMIKLILSYIDGVPKHSVDLEMNSSRGSLDELTQHLRKMSMPTPILDVSSSIAG